MKIAKIKHYAKSLIELGLEHNCYDEIIEELKSVEEKLAENLDFKKYLMNKQVTFAEKKKSLVHIFQDFLSKRTYNFLYLLIKNNKLIYLSQILQQTKKVNLKNNQVEEIVVESVVPLTTEMEKAINQIVEKKIGSSVVLRNVINESLLGGLKIIIGDRVIDGSVYGKINRLEKKIENFE